MFRLLVLLFCGFCCCCCGGGEVADLPSRGDSGQVGDTDFLVDMSTDGVMVRAVDGLGNELVGVLIRYGWPRHVSLWGDGALELVLSEKGVRFSAGDGSPEAYATAAQADAVLAPYEQLLTLALPLVSDERIVAVIRGGELSVGAPILQSAAISGSEGYWCGVGAAGAMMVGGPASAFLYAIACGMFADMDSW
jgi:hypothetical protein